MSAERNASYRQILRSTSVIGGSSLVNVLLGILRTKALAAMLGPGGVGLGGIYGSIMSTAGILAGLGLSTSGVRQLAEALGRGDERAASIVRKVLWYANLASGLLGAAALWALREPVAQWVFGDLAQADAVGWLGIGLLLGAVAGSQTVLLQGFRRIGDLGRISMAGAAFGSLAAVGFVYALGRDGVIWFVLVNPAANVLIAWRYAARLPAPAHSPSWGEMGRELRTLLGLGFVLMLASLMQGGVQLAVRALVARELGVEAVGQFQAAWAVSMQYIGFVLAAMGADYYPRLTAAIHDRGQANRLVNEQAEVALLLAGPVLLGMMTLAPLVIDALYAPSFRPAVDVLRWQILGDLVKVAAWPIGFILLARREGKLFFATELTWNACYLGFVWLGLPLLGLASTGQGFLFAYAVFYCGVFATVKRLTGFQWEAGNRRLFGGLAAMALAILAIFAAPGWLDWLAAHFELGLAPGAAAALAEYSTAAGYGVGLACSAATAWFAVRRLNRLADFYGTLRRKFKRL